MARASLQDLCRQAYVSVWCDPQDDVLLHCLTVRETFLVAAKLRLPGSVPTAEKEAVVEAVIQELGLVKAANTKIGNSCARRHAVLSLCRDQGQCCLGAVTLHSSNYSRRPVTPSSMRQVLM